MVGIWRFLVEVNLGVREAKESSDKECIFSPRSGDWTPGDSLCLVGLVSLCLERILDSLVPKTVSGGRLGLDHFRVVVDSPSLGQILGNFVLKTIGVGWLDLDYFEFVVVGPSLGQILGTWCSRLSEWVGLVWIASSSL